MKKTIAALSVAILLFSSLMIIFPNSSVKASESIVYVDDDNIEGPWYGTQEHPFLKIQDGVNAASTDGVVYVLNGAYYENIVIAKTIEIKGSSKGNVILDGSGSGNVVQVTADNVTIHYFTIKNSTYGIRLSSSSNNTIKDNTIRDTDYGVYLGDSSNNTIYHNNFINNIQHAYETENNTWDNGYSSGGNYWDDYTGEDAVYNITGGTSQDRYPLMNYINELPAPNFTFLPPAPTTQDTIQFIDESADSDGYITSWSWDFGDKNTSNQKNPTHRYADDGMYTVTLKVTDDLGVSANKSHGINVLNVGPTADLNYGPAVPTDLQNVSFTDESVDLDGYITSWSWDFGDGNTSSLKNPFHTYGDDGVYDVTLNVADDDGAGAVIQKQITVLNVAPSVGFTYNPRTPTTNDTIQLSDTSIDPDGTIVSWSWDLGDGTTSNQQNPTIKYSYGGSYKVSLTVVDDDGDSSTVRKYVRVAEEAVIHEDYIGWAIVFIVFIVIFLLMIGVVFYITKKYQ
jgi:parallel beta-helix repeat protein